MTNINGAEIKQLFEEEFDFIPNNKKSLFIVLGLLGDFDSFEYLQSIMDNYKKIQSTQIDIYAVAIGNLESKKYFCEYTNFPSDHLRVVENNIIHNKLGLNSGLNLPISPLLNLMIMCLGIKSEGTLLEVIRGYKGDRNAKQIFSDNQTLSFFNMISFKAARFKVLGGAGFLRPFELATLRLMNMCEVIKYWHIYMFNNKFLTQRNGNFLIDSSLNVIYSYRSKGLLDFSADMSNPLKFLYNNL